MTIFVGQTKKKSMFIIGQKEYKPDSKMIKIKGIVDC